VPSPAIITPTAGAEPSFRASLQKGGERELRDYGWRPRLTRASSILELHIDGEWTRVEDAADALLERRTKRDPIGFCDASCRDR
jgi:hypothetical protein